ncbi:MAG: tetratricopeptide repeat protein [Candidatus Kapabacteria bacterium]|nr:tetratricopeptide repeat protein [Candidatus Kapabacteria bacterium]
MHVVGACVALFHIAVFAQPSTKASKLSSAQAAKLDEITAKAAVIAEKDPQQALQLYNQALSMAPQQPELYLMRGYTYLRFAGNLSAAEADFSRAIALSPKLAGAYYYRGMMRFNAQRLAEAESDIKEAIKLGFKHSEVHANLAAIQNLLGKYTDALHSASIAVQRNPRSAFAYRVRGDIYRIIKQYHNALKDYNQVLKLQPDYYDVYSNRAVMRFEIGDINGAIADFTHLIKVSPTALNYYNRARAMFVMERYDEAAHDCKAALEIDVQHLLSRKLLVYSYLMLRKDSLVVREATEFLRKNSQDKGAFINAGNPVQAFLKKDDFINRDIFSIRAEARYRLGDVAGACVDASKASVLNPNSVGVSSFGFCKVHGIFAKDNTFPQSKQLYPRGGDNMATVVLSGTLLKDGFDSAYALVYKNGILQSRVAAPLRYHSFTNVVGQEVEVVTQASIALTVSLRAELAEYSLLLGVRAGTRDTIVARADSVVCGDVILVSGQSNAVLGTLETMPHHEYLRTYALASNDAYWEIARANNDTDDYNVGGIALQLMERIVAEQRVPVCVINAGLSGSTIEQHQRYDSLPLSPLSWYGRMLWSAQESGLARFVKAIIWYQGESNRGEEYTEQFTRLYRAWHSDFPALRKIYVVQIHPSHCADIVTHALVREQQRQFARVFPDVESVASIGIPSYDGCHFGNEGYRALGDRLYRLVARDIYASSDTTGIASPNLRRAYWKNKERTELVLEFITNDSLVLGSDTVIAGATRSLIRDAFMLNGAPVECQSIRIEHRNAVVLRFAVPRTEQTVSYIPERCYGGSLEASCAIYLGPWIQTRRGVAALTFHNVPIGEAQ